jgi:hypothetical protein
LAPRTALYSRFADHSLLKGRCDAGVLPILILLPKILFHKEEKGFKEKERKVKGGCEGK